MLVVVQDVVLGKMCITLLLPQCVPYLFIEHIYEGNRAVVGFLVLLSLLEYWGYICSFPVFRHFLLVFEAL